IETWREIVFGGAVLDDETSRCDGLSGDTYNATATDALAGSGPRGRSLVRRDRASAGPIPPGAAAERLPASNANANGFQSRGASHGFLQLPAKSYSILALSAHLAHLLTRGGLLVRRLGRHQLPGQFSGPEAAIAGHSRAGQASSARHAAESFRTVAVGTIAN